MRRSFVLHPRASADSQLAKMGGLADHEIAGIIQRSCEQGRTRMCKVMDETDTRRDETHAVKVRQERP